MKAWTATILAVGAGFASAQIALAQPVEKATDLTPFTTLDLRGCFESTLVAGTPERVVVRATAEQQALISVVQEKDVVKIGPLDDDKELCRGEPVSVHVTASFAKDGPVQLSLEGSGDFDADVPAADELIASIDGSGDLRLRGAAAKCEISLGGSGDLLAQSLRCEKETEVELRGSGSVTLRGETKSCAFDVKGSGDVDASDYSCDSAEVKINGSGSVDLARIKALDVQIRGSGDVNYRGEPDRRQMDIKGSGNVNQR